MSFISITKRLIQNHPPLCEESSLEKSGTIKIQIFLVETEEFSSILGKHFAGPVVVLSESSTVAQVENVQIARRTSAKQRNPRRRSRKAGVAMKARRP